MKLIAAAAALMLTSLAGAAEAQGTLRIGVIGKLQNAHPDLTGGGWPIGGLALRGLSYFDGQVVMSCLLCEVMPTVENGLVTDDVDPQGRAGQKVRFKLRPGLKWDDGAPVTAADFVRAWEVGRGEGSGYAWRSRLVGEIWAADALDADTFEIRRTGKSCTPGDFRFAPLRTDGKTLTSAPATPGQYNGPYRVESLEGQRAVLVRNPHWGGVKPAHDKIELVYRPDAQAMEQAMAAGEIDMITDISPTLAQAGAKAAPGRFELVERPGRSLMQAVLNLDDPLLGDVRVRRALLLALDRPALARLASDKAVPTRSFLSQRFPYFAPSLAEGGDAKARVQAASLLEAAGWRLAPDGVRRDAAGRPLKLRLAVQASQKDKPFVAAMIAAWRAIGVEAVPETWGGMAQLTGENPPQIALFGYTLEGGANIDFHVFDSGSIPKLGEVRNGLNIFRYRSAGADAAIAVLRDACGPGELKAAYGQLQARVAEDLPMLPLFFSPEAHLLPPSMPVPDAGRVQFLLMQEVEAWPAAKAPA